jgi:hypothetical protein
MAYDLTYDEGLEEDLDRLMPDERAAWHALFDALYEVPALRELLEVNRDANDSPPRFDHQAVVVLCSAGFNVARIKLRTARNGQPWPHRLLFALDHRSRLIWLLGLMPREEDYERSRPTVSRVLNRYDHHAIPRAVR